MKNKEKRVKPFQMTGDDVKNLEFLMQSTPEKLLDWYKKSSNDDLEYAQELFQARATELIIKNIELLDSVYDVRYAILANDIVNRVKCL